MIGRIARTVAMAIAITVLTVSGPYVLVYLARWEWNRAIVSALVFLSTLVIVSTALVLRSFRRIEARLDSIERGRGADVRGAIRTANDEAAGRHFEWLERPPDGPAVFVPVLLGAGAVLSALAYVIERAAGLVAGATLDRRTAAALPLDLPLSSAAPVEASPPAGSRPGEGVRRGRFVLAALLAVALTAGGIEVTRRFTQTRPGRLSSPGATTLVLTVERMDPWLSAERAAESLWVACRERLDGELTAVATPHPGSDEVVLEIDRALGHTGELRIVGCMEDFTISRVLADVTSVEIVRTGGHQAGDSD